MNLRALNRDRIYKLKSLKLTMTRRDISLLNGTLINREIQALDLEYRKDEDGNIYGTLKFTESLARSHLRGTNISDHNFHSEKFNRMVMLNKIDAMCPVFDTNQLVTIRFTIRIN